MIGQNRRAYRFFFGMESKSSTLLPTILLSIAQFPPISSAKKNFVRRPTLILDKSDNIAVACVGKPTEDASHRSPDGLWGSCVARLASTMGSTCARHNAAFSAKHRCHRRGRYTVASFGENYSNGMKVSLL